MHISSKTPTAGIILAAGMSSRFGKPKQLAELQEKPLLEWVLDACIGSKLERIFLILGYKHEKILDTLSHKICHPAIETVINPEYSKGQSTSTKTGIKAIKNRYPAAMFLLGDQPLVDSETINFLLERFWISSKNICVPYHNKKRGTPTIFGNKYYDQILRIEGDVGARHLIEYNDDDVLKIELKDSSIFFDIDTNEDLQKIKTLLSPTTTNQKTS